MNKKIIFFTIGYILIYITLILLKCIHFDIISFSIPLFFGILSDIYNFSYGRSTIMKGKTIFKYLSCLFVIISLIVFVFHFIGLFTLDVTVPIFLLCIGVSAITSTLYNHPTNLKMIVFIIVLIILSLVIL